MEMRPFTLLPGMVLAVLLIGGPGITGVALASDGPKCTLGTLDGLYVFTATGFTTISPAATPTSPKAIIEVIRFNGDGTLDVPAATRSINGTIGVSPPGGTGAYTVADLVPADGACTGTLTFLPSGPHFDLFIPLNGKPMWMIQTDQGNVFQGTVTKVSN
jgi:hypothetical protein